MKFFTQERSLLLLQLETYKGKMARLINVLSYTLMITEEGVLCTTLSRSIQLMKKIIIKLSGQMVSGN